MQIWNTSNTAKPLIEEFESTINIWDVKWINENRLAFGCGPNVPEYQKKHNAKMDTGSVNGGTSEVNHGTIEVNEIGAKNPIKVIEAHRNDETLKPLTLEQSLKLHQQYLTL